MRFSMIAIRRGYVFSATSGLVIGIYLLGYTHMKGLLEAVLGIPDNNAFPLVEIFFLTIAVIAFQPLLSFLEDVVERIFFESGQDHQYVLKSLGRELFGILDPSQLREKVKTTLQEALMVENVHLLLPKVYAEVKRTADGRKLSHSIFCATGRPFPQNLDAPAATNIKPSEEREVHFESNGQFISLMARMEAPVYANEVLPKINLPAEQKNLMRLRARLFLPLMHHDELVGVLALGKKITQRRFSYEDMTLLSLLSTQIVMALENIRLYQERLATQRLEEELNLAREIQRMLLPRQPPRSEYFDIAAINLPSLEVGGDYYDFLELPKGLIGIAIGDIAGKGVPGAILMSNLQATGRAAAMRSTRTHLVMQELNNQLSRTTAAEKYATFFYGILWPEKKLTFTNAGHNYPILCRSNGTIRELRQSNLIVGVREGISYDEHTISLPSGDALIFYTDGVTEAMNSNMEEFGVERLGAAIRSAADRSAEDLRNAIYERVLEFAGDRPQQDDLTLVVVKVK
ncbi:MAG: SpoIIE family protein phosphatase [candidate division KSB1 bacterium]|nr:SpoIIE family protein phosphatase [candidate division KSB1 bacterium]